MFFKNTLFKCVFILMKCFDIFYQNSVQKLLCLLSTSSNNKYHSFIFLEKTIANEYLPKLQVLPCFDLEFRSSFSIMPSKLKISLIILRIKSLIRFYGNIPSIYFNLSFLIEGFRDFIAQT